MSHDELIAGASAARRAGRLDEACALCAQLLQLDPSDPFALLELAAVRNATDKSYSARDDIKRIVNQRPSDPMLRNSAALVLMDLGIMDGALVQMREAHRLLPQSPEILNNLGGLLQQQGLLDEAISAYRKCAALAPHTAIVHCNLGEALKKAGQGAEAITAFRMAATLDPNLHDAWSQLGEALISSGSPAAALGPLRRSAELQPDHAPTCFNLAIAMESLKDFAQAISWFDRAIQLEPRQIEYRHALARVQMQSGQFAQALITLQEARQLDPNNGPVIHDLAKALMQLGCIEKAMALLREAFTLISAESKTLLLQNLAVIVPGNLFDDNQSVLETRRQYARQFESRPRQHRPARSGSGLVRIGFVSSFFHRQNWMKPVWPLINHHDREQFEIYLYSDAPASQCQYGYRPHPRDRFHDISGQSNAAVAKQIARHKIDLLIDLNSYSEPHRLGIFPLRPAPVQAAWFNLYATSGMDCFDYLIGDSTVIPPAEEAFYTERILRVPHSYLTFLVDYQVPDIAPAPPCRTSPMTIGCLASQYKITDQVIETWATILHRTPAKLLIRNRTLGQSSNRDFLIKRFNALNIPETRLELLGPADHLEFLSTYDRIDFAVDTFPYSGGTTTTEALWQGLPVFTFNGDRWASRTSASLLNAAGLSEFIAPDRDAYIELCVNFANSPDTPARLTDFRARIRPMLQSSPVCDVGAFTRSMENLYLQMLGGAPR